MTILGVPPMFGWGMRALNRIAEDAQDDRHPDMPELIGTFAFWAVALDEGLREIHGARQYGALRRAHLAGAVMPGLRLARNAVAHGLLIAPRAAGMTFPMTFPLDYGVWVWKPLDELLRDWTPQTTRWLVDEQQSYATHLAARPPGEAMCSAVEWLSEFSAG